MSKPWQAVPLWPKVHLLQAAATTRQLRMVMIYKAGRAMLDKDTGPDFDKEDAVNVSVG